MTKLTIEIDDQAHGADATHTPLVHVSVDGEPVGIIQTLMLEVMEGLLIPKVGISVTDYSALCVDETDAAANRRNIARLRKVKFLKLDVVVLKSQKETL